MRPSENRLNMHSRAFNITDVRRFTLIGLKLKGALKQRKHNFAVSYKQTTSNGDYEITASLAVLCEVSRSNCAVHVLCEMERYEWQESDKH
jgi:hypothetical protein